MAQSQSSLSFALDSSSPMCRISVWPRPDPVLFQSGQRGVLHNFLELEQHQLPKPNYFETVQTEVTVQMRSTIMEWMKEVCDEEGCSCEVFPLAVNYLDRFLSVDAIHRNQLQALATACLFLASKTKLARPLNGARLVLFTDGGVTVSELLSWELLVLRHLQWDIASLTAYDFLEQYMHQLRLSTEQRHRLQDSLLFLVERMAKEFPTAVLAPSEIGAVCLSTAVAHAYGTQHIIFHGCMEALGQTVGHTVDPSNPHSSAIVDVIRAYRATFYNSPGALHQLQLCSPIPDQPQKLGTDSSMDCENDTMYTQTDITDITIL